MSEIIEAEAFSRELDNLLAGKPSDAAGELAADLEFAAALRRSDLSAQSTIKGSLKAKILAHRRPDRARRAYSWIAAHPRALGGACALAAAVLALPAAMHWMSDGREDIALTSALNGSRALLETTTGINPGMARITSNAGRGLGIANGGSSASSSLGPVSSAGLASGYAGVKGVARGQSSGGGGLEALKAAANNAGDQYDGTPYALDQAAAQSVPTGGSPFGGLDASLAGSDKDSKSGNLSAAGKFGTLRAKRARPASARGQSAGVQTTFVLPNIPPTQDFNREGYDSFVENEYQTVVDNPLSTFSIDVDAASYANIRRFLSRNQLPPKDAVRVEEIVNYFRYEYPQPQGDDPFSITAESAACPWNDAHKLVRIGLKGKEVAKADLPPSNLVFLIDSSGSMMEPDKLPLLKRGLRLLVDELRPQDRISIVTYAGAAGLVLPSTPGSEKERIVEALEGLEAGGSTAGGAGIQLAYEVATQNFLKHGLNRVILATDGDFNVGVTSDGELSRLIEQERESGVFLTVLGFGTGNYQDAKMKMLADKGNGNYAYVDDILEARRVLVREMGATLMTKAKDVKIQVEFNPARVQAYRLIGYEHRMLKAEDFNNDKKDAGELGAGHTVTALYEIVPPGAKADASSVDPLKYQKTRPAAASSDSGELLTVKFRYKKPDGETSRLIARPLDDKPRAWADAAPDFRFAAAAAGFGMLLRGSPNAGNLTYAKVRAMAMGAKGADADGYRAEFIRLVDKADALTSTGGRNPD